MRVGTVLCAAGQGKRMQLGKNKQFLELQGKPLLIHTVEAMTKSALIDRITLVVATDELEFVRQMLKDYDLEDKIEHIVIGGQERQESVFHGLQALAAEGKPEYVLIHDGARPFVSVEEIEAVLSEVEQSKAAVLAVPVTDTIKKATAQGSVVETLNRAELWSIQTPQVFSFPLIFEAHQAAQADGYLGTDDASLVERLGWQVKLVKGSYHNIKLTTLEDICLAEYILQRRRLSE